MSEDQDYAAHFADPDTLVNWDFVEQVVSGFTKFSKSLEGASWLKAAFEQQLLALLNVGYVFWLVFKKKSFIYHYT